MPFDYPPMQPNLPPPGLNGPFTFGNQPPDPTLGLALLRQMQMAARPQWTPPATAQLPPQMGLPPAPPPAMPPRMESVGPPDLAAHRAFSMGQAGPWIPPQVPEDAILQDKVDAIVQSRGAPTPAQLQQWTQENYVGPHATMGFGTEIGRDMLPDPMRVQPGHSPLGAPPHQPGMANQAALNEAMGVGVPDNPAEMPVAPPDVLDKMARLQQAALHGTKEMPAVGFQSPGDDAWQQHLDATRARLEFIRSLPGGSAMAWLGQNPMPALTPTGSRSPSRPNVVLADGDKALLAARRDAMAEKKAERQSRVVSNASQQAADRKTRLGVRAAGGVLPYLMERAANGDENAQRFFTSPEAQAAEAQAQAFAAREDQQHQNALELQKNDQNFKAQQVDKELAAQKEAQGAKDRKDKISESLGLDEAWSGLPLAEQAAHGNDKASYMKYLEGDQDATALYNERSKYVVPSENGASWDFSKFAGEHAADPVGAIEKWKALTGMTDQEVVADWPGDWFGPNRSFAMPNGIGYITWDPRTGGFDYKPNMGPFDIETPPFSGPPPEAESRAIGVGALRGRYGPSS